MSKDYKHSGKSRTAHHGSSSIWVGLLIGLCIGVGIAVAAVVYMNRAPNPFANKTQVTKPVPDTPPPTVTHNAKQPEVLTPQGAVPRQNPAPGAAPAEAKPEGEKFEFYTKLMESSDAKEPKPPQPAQPPETPPPAQVLPPKGTYLQLGAFQNEKDADNLKAKLAMMGVEANIQTSEVDGKGVLHRVRIGPFKNIEDLDRVRDQLKGSGVEVAVVKN
ncbi:SPOR domain-containing protein [Chitinimonas lacunae]|uniref:SPOR domain-containing protein n=1 Tax=Chitinimonas lacunae TaxID=1963018 RepID=A0ABV8MRG4_9NEIS